VRGLLVLLVLGACNAAEVPVSVPPVSKGTVRIRSFTEPSAARQIRVAGRFVFVVTGQGIERWGADGNVIELSATHGLPSDDISSVAVDGEHKAMWILTPGSLGRYDTATEVYTQVAEPIASVGLQLAALRASDRTALAAATDGGAWVGTPQGLHYGSDEGWASTTIKEPVLSLAMANDGVVIATNKGLMMRRTSGEVIAIGAEQGCLVARPELVLSAPKLGGTLVIGSDENGAPRLAIGRGSQWHSFRVLPGTGFDDAVAHGDEVLLMGGGQLYRLTLRDQSEPRPLARDGVRLSAMSSAGPDLALSSMPTLLPPGAVSLAVSGELLLVGTRDIGVARYLQSEARPSSWLRRRRMFVDATTLSVACAAQDNCWVATGSRSAWHWTGDRFAAGGPDDVVLAVVRDRTGVIFALHRAARATAIQLSRVDLAGVWTRIPKIALATPGQDPEISFVRFASSGALWVGLRYRDGVEVRAWGVAVVEIGSGKVQYHHTSANADERKKMMPIPVGVVDADVRGDAAWFATNEGVARLTLGTVKIWNESNGLRSELARAIAVSRSSAVFVATGAGVGRFDGVAWQFPVQLRFEVNDLAVTAGGQLWMATGRGIAAYDGTKVRRVDLRRGLVENQIVDIAIDRYDRIWGRGPGSLTLISP
jgi:ligand-binding sensor domain-containing protein